MSRQDVIKKLKKKNPKLNNSEIEIVIETFCNSITEGLGNGRNIELRKFGTFMLRKLKERHSARNPKTGKLVYVPEKNKVRFKASKKLKEFINK